MSGRKEGSTLSSVNCECRWRHTSGDECSLIGHCTTSSLTALYGSVKGKASVVDGEGNVAGELKETGQRSLTTHTRMCVPRPCARTYKHTVVC